MTTGKQASSPYSKRVQELLTLAEDGHVELLDNRLGALIADPYAPPEHQGEVEVLYLNLKDEEAPASASEKVLACRRLLQGAFGFFLFTSVAEEATSMIDKAAEEEIRGRADEFLRDPETLAFIFRKYGVPQKYHVATLWLHKSGTTSYILKFKLEDKNFVLKIVKSYYLDNQNIAEH